MDILATGPTGIKGQGRCEASVSLWVANSFRISKNVVYQGDQVFHSFFVCATGIAPCSQSQHKTATAAVVLGDDGMLVGCQSLGDRDLGFAAWPCNEEHRD